MPKIKEPKITNWDALPLMLTKKEISEYFRTNLREVTKWFDSKDFPKLNSGKVEKNLFREWYYKNHDKLNYKNLSTIQVSEIVEKTIREFTKSMIDTYKKEVG